MNYVVARRTKHSAPFCICKVEMEGREKACICKVEMEGREGAVEVQSIKLPSLFRCVVLLCLILARWCVVDSVVIDGSVLAFNLGDAPVDQKPNPEPRSKERYALLVLFNSTLVYLHVETNWRSSRVLRFVSRASLECTGLPKSGL